MTYREKLVAVVKANGKVLREIDGTATLPFGSEYSILIKNMDSRRVQVSVSIDGDDVADGRLVIWPNSSMEIERFIRNGNMHSGNRFKFIERTPDIEQHRGVGIEDGLIRVEAWSECLPTTTTYYHQTYFTVHPPHWPAPRWRNTHDPMRSARPSGRASGESQTGSGGANANYVSSTADSSAYTDNVTLTTGCDAGVTVPGSESHQQFSYVPDFPLESQSNVIVLRLRGMIGNHLVAAPITVKTKPVCVTCGRTNESNARFCVHCGTALTII